MPFSHVSPQGLVRAIHGDHFKSVFGELAYLLGHCDPKGLHLTGKNSGLKVVLWHGSGQARLPSEVVEAGILWTVALSP